MENTKIEKEMLSRLKIDYLGDDCIMIQNKFFNFTYFVADKVLKPECKGKYRYFGGLQSSFEEESKEYKYLENRLCEISESIFNTFKK